MKHSCLLSNQVLDEPLHGVAAGTEEHPQQEEEQEWDPAKVLKNPIYVPHTNTPGQTVYIEGPAHVGKREVLRRIREIIGDVRFVGEG